MYKNGSAYFETFFTGKLAIEPEEKLQLFLRRHGLRQTPQRLLILEVFLDMDGHPSPEELRDELLLRGHAIGLSTIYRTLRLFLDSGIARKHQFGDGLCRYEPEKGGMPHVHLVCEICGRRLEASSKLVAESFKDLSSSHAFFLSSHQTVLYGICDVCAKACRAGNALQSIVETIRQGKEYDTP
jgi:Fur family ferric uptake transcriptional regulator